MAPHILIDLEESFQKLEKLVSMVDKLAKKGSVRKSFPYSVQMQIRAIGMYCLLVLPVQSASPGRFSELSVTHSTSWKFTCLERKLLEAEEWWMQDSLHWDIRPGSMAQLACKGDHPNGSQCRGQNAFSLSPGLYRSTGHLSQPNADCLVFVKASLYPGSLICVVWNWTVPHASLELRVKDPASTQCSVVCAASLKILQLVWVEAVCLYPCLHCGILLNSTGGHWCIVETSVRAY